MPKAHIVHGLLFDPHTVIIIAVICLVPGFSEHIIWFEIAIHNIGIDGVFIVMMHFLASFLKVEIHERLGLVRERVLIRMFFKLIVGEGVNLVSMKRRGVEFVHLELCGFRLQLFVMFGLVGVVFLLDDKIAIRKHEFVVRNYLYNMISATNNDDIIRRIKELTEIKSTFSTTPPLPFLIFLLGIN